MIEKKIMVEGRPMKLRSSALIPKLYRAYFGRDMIKDMKTLIKAYKRLAELKKNKATKEEIEDAQFDITDIEIFERVAWLMLKHGGESVGESPEDWLESMDYIFSIYEVLPVVAELWSFNNKTTSIPKKK